MSLYDIVALGVALDSTQVVKGAQDFDRFASSADKAADATERLEKKSAIAFLILKRANDEFDRGADHLKKYESHLLSLANAQDKVGGTSGVLSNAAGSLTRSIVSTGIEFVKTTARTTAYGLAASLTTSAIDHLVQSQMKLTRTTEESLGEQSRVLADIAERYKETANQVERINRATSDTLALQLAELKVQRQKELNTELERYNKLITAPTQLAGEMGDAPTGLGPAVGLEKFAGPIERFLDRISSGAPDVRRFQDEVSKLGLASPEIQGLANWLVEASKQSDKFEVKLQELSQGVDRLANGLKEFNREGASAKQLIADLTEGFGRLKAVTDEAEGSGIFRDTGQTEGGNKTEGKFEREADAMEKHIALMVADAKAVGLGVAAREEFRTRGRLEEAIRRDSDSAEEAAETIKEYSKQIAELSRRAGEAAKELATMRAEADMIRERADIFRSPTESRVSRTLERTGLTEADARGKAIADYIRMNETLKEVKDTSLEFTTDFVKGLMKGESAMQALGRAATNLSTKLAESAIQDLFTGNFVSAGIKGIAAAGAYLFGKNQQEQQKQAQEYWDAVGRAVDNSMRAAMARIDTSELSGALAAMELQHQRERREETYKGGKAMTSLILAQQAEELKLREEFAEKQLEIDRRLNRRRLDYQDREFNASNDTTTLAGALASHQRKWTRELLDEQEAGGELRVELERALLAEEMQIRRDFAARAIEETRRAEEQRINELNRSTLGITNYLLDLERSDEIVSPGQALATARAAFEATRALAQGGNADAYGRITGDADALISAARTALSSGPEFQAIYQQVRTGLLGLPAMTTSSDPVVATLLDILGAVEEQTSALLLNVIAAINTGSSSATAAALSPLFTTLGGTVDQGLTLSELTGAVAPLARDVGIQTIAAQTSGASPIYSGLTAISTATGTVNGTVSNSLGPGGTLNTSIAGSAAYSLTERLRTIFNELDNNGNGILELGELTANNVEDVNTSIDGSGGTNDILAELRSLNTLLNRQLTGQVTVGAGAIQTWVPYQKPDLSWDHRLVTTINGVTNYEQQYSAGVLPTLSGTQYQRSLQAQAALRVPDTIDNSLLSVLNKIAWNTYATAHNTGVVAMGQSLTHLFGIYEKGGLVGGNLHSSGGTMAELERGEFVMNRRAVAQFGVGAMEDINSGRMPAMGGGAVVAAIVSAIARMSEAVVRALEANNRIAVANLELQREWKNEQSREAARAMGLVQR